MLRNLFSHKKNLYLPSGLSRRELIQREAKVGAGLFGFIPANRRREFFRLETGVWVWFEEWRDAKGTHRITTRYEIHGDNIIKIQNEQAAVLVTGDELENFYQAVKAYYYAVADQVYHRPIPISQRA